MSTTINNPDYAIEDDHVLSTELANDSLTAVIEIDTQARKLRDAMKALADSRKALMPRISANEREQVIQHERSIAVSEAKSRYIGDLRRDRQMTDEDRDQIAAAKLEHKKLINTDEQKASAQFHIGKAYLSQFKLVHRKDGRIGVRVTGII